MAKKQKPANKPAKTPVHDALNNMDIRVNELGQIVRDYHIEDINAFLDKHVKDKKLNENSDT